MKKHKMTIQLTPKQKENILLYWCKKYGYKSKYAVNVAMHFDVCERQLWRWRVLYEKYGIDGLINKSTVPHTPHPLAPTTRQINCLKELLKDKNMLLTEVWDIMQETCHYKRNYFSMTQYIRRHKMREQAKYERYKSKPYKTPLMIGEKWQLDIKYVPRKCYIKYGKIQVKAIQQLYQYTIIDEATRERYMWIADRKTAENTCIFVLLAIDFLGYIPETIQTDNGKEFTNRYINTQKIHALDELCNKLGIYHKLIAPGTPRWNGKVERSHRIDQQCFYNKVTYTDIDDLQEQLAQWVKRYNNISKVVLQDGKRRMISPNQKRAELLAELEYLHALPPVDFFVTIDGTASPLPKVRFTEQQAA